MRKNFAKNKPLRLSRRDKGKLRLVQLFVFTIGVVLTGIVFITLSYVTHNISKDEYARTLNEAGKNLVSRISELENAMRIISSIFLVSENLNVENLAQEIRRNVPNLSKFDQIGVLYERKPGSWGYQVIFETIQSGNSSTNYRFVPDQEIISRLVQDGIFETTDIRVISDFKGMDYGLESGAINRRSRSFALIKTVEKGNSGNGVVIGITRPSLLIDEKFFDQKNTISKLIIREDDAARRMIFHMDRTSFEKSVSDVEQLYSFSIGSRQWQILLGFMSDKNVLFMQKVPYVVLVVGAILTFLGIAFVRNNYKNAERLSFVNSDLEKKNYELENEISERERLNKILVQSEKENRAIIDSVSDVIFETDTSGSLLFLSAAWRRVTGFDPDHSLGTDLFSILHMDDQEKQRNDLAIMVKGQKSAYRSFTRIRISDGTFRSVELAISMIRQDENKNLRVVGTITDVEERRRAERALAEAEKKYRTIVENAAGGLFQITPEGMILSANPAMARILGYGSVEEMLRLVKNVFGYVFYNIEERKEFLKNLSMKSQIFGHEVQVIKKDKNVIWVSENIRIVKDEMQNILYYEGSMEDVTSRKEANIALMDAKLQSDIASKAKTEFIANMSHELRTPLNAIIGFSEIIKNQVMGAIQQTIYLEYANDIHQSGKSLLKIINEILDISKIEAGKKELRESEISVEQCLVSCKESFSEKISEKKLLLLDKTSQLPIVRAEETAYKQIIRNILSNAIQFTPEEGRIALFSNYDHDGSFRLSISDTGVGLTQKEIEKALSPFGQIDNALDRSGAGTGLGLPLAKALIELHGGSLEILSEKGIGTTVAIIIPSQRIISNQTSSKLENV